MFDKVTVLESQRTSADYVWRAGGTIAKYITTVRSEGHCAQLRSTRRIDICGTAEQTYESVMRIRKEGPSQQQHARGDAISSSGIMRIITWKLDSAEPSTVAVAIRELPTVPYHHLW